MYSLQNVPSKMLLSLTLLIGISSFFVSGCASPAQSINMVPKSIKILNTHEHSVRVEAKGGEETNPMWTSEISNEAFIEAVEKSLKKYRVFSKVLKDGDSEYLLEVAITELSQPLVGFDMEVSLVAHWSLRNMATNELVWRDLISSNYTATVGDAFAAIKRLRLANEGAARKNIERGIKELSLQDL